MAEAKIMSDRVERVISPVMVHSARTAVVAVTSLLVARLFRLPEAYWAPITTLVITQSSLGAAFSVSWQRFVGTLLGAVLGALAASYFGPRVLVFGSSVFILGLLRALARLDLPGYRFGAVTLAIVVLIPRTGPTWQTAFHRFAGSLHWNWRGANIGVGMAGEGSHIITGFSLFTLKVVLSGSGDEIIWQEAIR